MNKILTKIVGAALGLSMAVGVGTAVAMNAKEPVRANADTFTLTTGDNLTSTSGTFLNGAITMSSAKNNSSNPPAYYAAGIRYYYASGGNGGSSTFTFSGITVSSVEITGVSGYTPTVKCNVDGGSDVSGTWSGTTMTISGLSAATSFKFRNAHTSNTQLRVSSIKFTYTSSGTTTHTITYDANVGSSGDVVTNMPSADSVVDGADYTLDSTTIPVRSGYIFEGWAENSQSTTKITELTNVTSDETVYAIWSVDSRVTVTFLAGTDTSDTSSLAKSGITLSVSNGVFNRSDNYRVYASATLTITSIVGNISEMIFDGTGADSGKSPSNLSTQTGIYSYAGSTGTWIGDAATVDFSSSAQSQIKSITIKYTAAALVEATDISFSPASITVDARQETSFVPTLTGGSGAYERTIGWVSSNTNVIASPANSEDGETVTFTPAFVSAQTIVTITGTVVSPGSATASITITVNPVTPSVQSVSLDKNTDSVDLGSTTELAATVIADAGASYSISWTSSDSTVASVAAKPNDDTKGIVTPVAIGTATITVSAGDKSATCLVTVNDPNAITDTLTRATTGISGNSYTAWSGKTKSIDGINSDATYAGQSAGEHDSIQLRSNNNNSGVITTTSGGTLKSVEVTFNSESADTRQVDVYAQNSAYSSPADLYSSSTQGTLVASFIYDKTNHPTKLSFSYTFEDDYTFIGFRSNSGALYIAEIKVMWVIKSADDPVITITSGTAGVMSGKVGDVDEVTYDVDYKEKTPSDYHVDWSVTDSDSILDFDDGDFVIVKVGNNAVITVLLKKGTTIISSDTVTVSVLAPTIKIKALSGEAVVADSLLIEKNAEGQLGYTATNIPDSDVDYTWYCSDDQGSYLTFDDTDGTYFAAEETSSPVLVTIVMTYDGTEIARNAIQVTIASYTGPIENGYYYIMNQYKSIGMTIDSYGTSSHPTGALMSTADNTMAPLALRLVGNDTYEITASINGETYYLINRNNSTSGSNDNVRLVKESDTAGYAKTWVITSYGTDGTTPLGEGLYNVKTNTTGDTWRYLTAYYATGSADFRGYVSPYNSASSDLSQQDSKLTFVKEGYYAEDVATKIKTSCVNRGSSSYDTTAWGSAKSAYNAIKIAHEKDLLIHGNAVKDSTDTIECALEQYDYAVVRYNLSGTADAFITGRTGIYPAVNGVNNLLTNLGSETTVSIIVVISVISITTIGTFVFVRRRKEN